MSDKKVALLGGDGRMLSAARCLSEKYGTAVWGFSALRGEDNVKYLTGAEICAGWEEAVGGAEAIVLPLPVSRDGVRLFLPLSESQEDVRLVELCEKIRPGALLLGGNIPLALAEAAVKRGIIVSDYYNDESVQILNSVICAEGAIAACIDTLPVTVSGMKAVVTGYGKIGRALALRLILLGAEVYVAARSRRDLAYARIDGCVPIPLEEYKQYPIICDAVFATAPAEIFSGDVISRMSGGEVIFDLAAKDGLIDIKAAEAYGVKVIPLPALPGKVSPDSAGEIICRAVGERVREYFGREERREKREERLGN